MSDTTVTRQLLFAVICSTFGTWFIGGYTATLINAPQYHILSWIRSVKCSRISISQYRAFNQSANETSVWCGQLPSNAAVSTLKQNNELNIIWGLIGCTINVGCFISLWTIRPLTEWGGFKRTMQLANAVTALGAILSSCCAVAASYELLIAGRLISGFGLGISATVVLPYLAEVSPAKHRGAVGTFPPLFSCAGMLTAAVLGLPQVLGTLENWPLLSCVYLVPCTVLCGALFIIPDSPRYLLLIKKDEAKARSSLEWLRRGTESDKEFQIIQGENAAHLLLSNTSISLAGLFRDRVLRRSLLTCVAAIVGQRFSGYVADKAGRPRFQLV